MITFTPHQSLFLFAAYMFGAIPFGVVISLLVVKKDVRDQGSGNTGATNVARLMGKKWGLFVLFLDALKGFIVVKLAHHWGFNFENVAAVFVIVGHCYPIYLGFKGGKGVATALGILGAIAPLVLGIVVTVFAVVFGISRRVSAGSLTAALSLPFIINFHHHSLNLWTATFITALIWWKHRENALRLWRNEEPAFF